MERVPTTFQIHKEYQELKERLSAIPARLKEERRAGFLYGLYVGIALTLAFTAVAALLGN